LAQGAGLGNVIIGRRGAKTRFDFDTAELGQFLGGAVSTENELTDQRSPEEYEARRTDRKEEEYEEFKDQDLGQAIFVAHGKKKKPLDQLKRILEQFKIPYRVAVEEPNLGRPIGTKIREIMKGCNCAILIFTADEEFKNSRDETVWRPSENVVYELGAAGYLYDSRIVILKEESVNFASNFHSSR
jgi:predicted nucleotide-binding protein